MKTLKIECQCDAERNALWMITGLFVLLVLVSSALVYLFGYAALG